VTSKPLSEQPEGLLALDPQLICYSWMIGISEVALVVFVRKNAPEIKYLKTSIGEDQRREFGQLVEPPPIRLKPANSFRTAGSAFPRTDV
jgi:hypothetical protein